MSEALPSFQFYRETRFKVAQIFERKVQIPSDWDFVSIEEIASKDKGSIKMGPFGSQLKKSELVENGPIKVYGQENVMKNDFTIGSRFITLEKFRKLKGFEILPGDVLLTMMGSVGFATVFPNDGQKGIMDSHLLRIRVDTTKVLPHYIALLFAGYSLAKIQIQRLSQGAIMSGLNTSLVKAIRIPLPPLPEQKKIAEVLRTIDEAIQAVDESITKLERLKKGTMERLLTRGINHTRFKEVELNGRKVKIPEEWEVVELGNPKYSEIIMGQSPPSSSYNQEGKGIPFIQGAAEFGHIYVSPRMFTTKPLKIAKKGDILISVRAPVGEVNIAPFELCIGRGVGAIRPNKKNADTYFLYYLLGSIKKDLERLGGGAVFKAITKNTLKNFQIPLPPLEEQKKIAEILRTIDEAIEAKKAKKEKLERMKKAVMEKLLTGEVRIR